MLGLNHSSLYASFRLHDPSLDLDLLYGAHDRSRTDEPLPYQGSALPTELRGQFGVISKYRAIENMERETRLELATSSLEG
jgi:hypothetical protein